MINVKKQILYWETGAEEELLNGRIMVENNRFLTSLFFCHLCLEKILKALVVKKTEQHPPRTHILSSLADTAGVVLDEFQEESFRKYKHTIWKGDTRSIFHRNQTSSKRRLILKKPLHCTNGSKRCYKTSSIIRAYP